MTAQLIDGKALAAKVKDGLRARVDAVGARRGFPPGIAVVRVAEDPASKIKPGAIVIDVGMNRGADGKLSGDVELKPPESRRPGSLPCPEVWGR